MNTDSQKVKSFYGSDPRELPLYGLMETSKYLKVNINTLKSWVKGRTYRLRDGSERFWEPVIQLPDLSQSRLSFLNLIEVHVLLGIRRIHNIQFQKVRDSLAYLEATFPETNHPLATEDFWTDTFDLFIKKAGGLICTSQEGQYVIEIALKQYLHRIDRDVNLEPFRLYPFVKEIVLGAEGSSNNLRTLESQPKSIVIDPLLSFGRPTIINTGIPTNVIAGRFGAGQNIKSIARDYGIEEEQVQEALLYEGVLSKAA